MAELYEQLADDSALSEEDRTELLESGAFTFQNRIASPARALVQIGVLITTSTFTEDARSYVARIEKRIVLIDGKELAQLMIQFGVGVSTEARYEVRRVDGDFFEV